MTSDLLRQVCDGMPDDFADPGDDAAATRAKFAPLHGHPVGADCVVAPADPGTTGGVPGLWLSVAGVTPGPGDGRGALVYCHGGAFVSCTAEEYLFYAELVARATGLPVLVVDYRLAPEHRFPAALDDCVAAYHGLTTGGGPGPVLVAGDSCGGGLALALAMAARDGGGPPPAAVLSLSGWIDLDTAAYGPDGAAGPDPFISEGFIRRRARDYLGPDGDPHRPAASPARGDPAGLPPVLLQVGEVDVCRLDAERFAARAAAAGVDVTVDVVAGGVHGVQGLSTIGVPEAAAAWAAVAAFTRRVLPGPVSGG